MFCPGYLGTRLQFSEVMDLGGTQEIQIKRNSQGRNCDLFLNFDFGVLAAENHGGPGPQN